MQTAYLVSCVCVCVCVCSRRLSSSGRSVPDGRRTGRSELRQRVDDPRVAGVGQLSTRHGAGG